MAHLYFRYSTMNAGKTIEVLKIAHNYEEQGKRVLIFTSAVDTRHGVGQIRSRIGLSRSAVAINADTDLLAEVERRKPLHCILVDEGQFLTPDHVEQFYTIVDTIHIPVIIYGLKADFQNKLFPGSEALLCWADKIEEVKTVCWFCDRKAMINMRIAGGKPVLEGEQIYIGGNESYVPVCRRCYRSADLEHKVFEFFGQ